MVAIIYDCSNDVIKLTSVLKQTKISLRVIMYITDLISDTDIAY